MSSKLLCRKWFNPRKFVHGSRLWAKGRWRSSTMMLLIFSFMKEICKKSNLPDHNSPQFNQRSFQTHLVYFQPVLSKSARRINACQFSTRVQTKKRILGLWSLPTFVLRSAGQPSCTQRVMFPALWWPFQVLPWFFVDLSHLQWVV